MSMFILAMAFYVGEIQSDLTKVCYYNDRGNIVAVTVGVVELCPLSIKVGED